MAVPFKPPARRTGTFDSVFIQQPPSEHLRLLPAPARITAVEICTFLPMWLKNADVSKRLYFNGIKGRHIAHILKHHVGLAREETKPNLFTYWMNNGMKKLTGNAKWTYAQDGIALDKSTWDPNSLTLTGCRLNIEHTMARKGTKVVLQNIKFSALARHVIEMPQGHDRLDLTRFVEYAVAHPEEDLQFPRDFNTLIQKLGSISVEPGHIDGAVAARWFWESVCVSLHQPAPPAIPPSPRQGVSFDSLSPTTGLTREEGHTTFYHNSTALPYPESITSARRHVNTSASAYCSSTYRHDPSFEISTSGHTIAGAEQEWALDRTSSHQNRQGSWITNGSPQASATSSAGLKRKQSFHNEHEFHKDRKRCKSAGGLAQDGLNATEQRGCSMANHEGVYKGGVSLKSQHWLGTMFPPRSEVEQAPGQMQHAHAEPADDGPLLSIEDINSLYAKLVSHYLYVAVPPAVGPRILER